MILYLVCVRIGYYKLYFKFKILENVISFVRFLKFTRICKIGDDVQANITVEVLTDQEYKEKVKEMED